MRPRDDTYITEAYRRVVEMAYGVSSTGAQNSITKAELAELIQQTERDKPGVSFMSVTQVTKETTRKAPGYNQFVLSGLSSGKTYFAKVSQVGCMIGNDYGKGKNKALAAAGMEADFVPQRSIYNQVGDSKVVQERNGQLYIKYTPQSISKKFSPVLVKANSTIPSEPSDFEIVSREEVNQFKAPVRDYGPGVQIRSLSLDSLAAINLNGQEYVISDLDQMRQSIWFVSGAPMPADMEADNIGRTL